MWRWKDDFGSWFQGGVEHINDEGEENEVYRGCECLSGGGQVGTLDVRGGAYTSGSGAGFAASIINVSDKFDLKKV